MKKVRCTSCSDGEMRATTMAGVLQCQSCKATADGPMRICCCIPFCHHTRGDRKGDPAPMERGHAYRWMCGKHWRHVPRRLRASLRLNDRRIERVLARRPEYAEWWKLPAGSPPRDRALSMWRRRDQIWSACEAASLSRSGGI